MASRIGVKYAFCTRYRLSALDLSMQKKETDNLLEQVLHLASQQGKAFSGLWRFSSSDLIHALPTPENQACD